tara:strand:- start:46 stop:567 length:522 start_codon:yes stop_codon:yes gene_type:complete
MKKNNFVNISKCIFLSLLLTNVGIKECISSEYLSGENQYILGNYESAIATFQPLLAKGHSGAETLTGIMYLKGEGYKANPKIAAVWFYKASNKGDHNAQLVLGTQYLHGLGVKKNIRKAYFWLSLASKSTNKKVAKQAQHFKNETSKLLDIKNKKIIENRIFNWKPMLSKFTN